MEKLKRLLLQTKDEEGETLSDKAWGNPIDNIILTICCVILIFVVILCRKQSRPCFRQRKTKKNIYKPKSTTMDDLSFKNSMFKNDVENDDDEDEFSI